MQNNLQENSLIPIIVSFPRSGSNFFADEFEAITGVDVKLTHAMLDADKIISCVRNPLDTLSSLIAMRLSTFHYELERANRADIIDDGNSIANFAEYSLQLTMSHYKRFYSYLLESKNILIDYDRFVDDVDPYVRLAAEKLGVDTMSDRIEPSMPADDLSSGFLRSSRISEYYQFSNDLVTSSDLEELNKLYGFALEKSLNL
jgi:hypothetical protein